jgi:hypothetical protein
MKTIFLASVMTLFCIATAVADVTVSINNVTQTEPTDSSGNVREKVGKDENASYSLTGSYNGLPPMNTEEKVTGTAWTYTIVSGSNVTCSPESGSGSSVAFTASSSYSGTYTITITMKVILKITKYKSDMQTVESTRDSKEYSKTTIVTLNVWGKLTIAAPDYLPVQSERKEVKITVNTTLTGALTDGTLTLTATDKLKLYVNEEGGTGSNSLNLILTNNAATCYVASGDSPSTNASDQILTATYSGTNVESAKKDLTVYELTIEAPGKMVHIGKIVYDVFTVPVMFNDDHDCGKEYLNAATWNCGVNCSNVPAGGTCSNDTHRELEPVWDYLYAGTCENEDDLVRVEVKITPTDMAGDVKVKPIGSEKDSKTVFNIRIWKNSKKGDKSSIITEKTYSVSELPQTMYVEGIAIGQDYIYAEYIPPQNKTVRQTEILNFDVVSLIETQMNHDKTNINGIETITDTPVRKIINDNREPITFTVKGGAVFIDKCKCKWTVPGHNDEENIGYSPSISVTYGETEECNVNLPENAKQKYRRFTTTVSVSIDEGKLELSRTIRVAQDDYQGTATAKSLEERRIQVSQLTALPPIDAFPTGTNFAQTQDNEYGSDFVANGNASIRYATKLVPYGMVKYTTDKGINKKIYGVMLSKTAYEDKLKREDLSAIAIHEVRHVNQLTLMRGQDEWAILDREWSHEALSPFMEADAYMENIRCNTCWKKTSYDLYNFKTNYIFAISLYTTGVDLYNSNDRTFDPNDIDILVAMKPILQLTYKRIPFIEMKKKGYNGYIRPPQQIVNKVNKK